MTHSSALGVPGVPPPGSVWALDRIYLGQCEAVEQQDGKPTGKVRVFIPILRQHLDGVRVAQPTRCNDEEDSEILPKIGDIGIIGSLNGDRHDAVWLGWLIQRKQPSYRGAEGVTRMLLEKGVLIEVDGGNLRLKTKVDPKTGAQPDGEGVYLYLKDDDTIVIFGAAGVAIRGEKGNGISMRSKAQISADVDAGKYIFLGTSSDGSGFSIVKKSWMDAMEAHITTLEAQIKVMAVALNTAGADPVLVGLASIAAGSIVAAGAAGQAIVEIGADPAYGTAKANGATTKVRAD